MSNNSNNGLNEGPFQIIINEKQRALLVKIMKFALKDIQFCIQLYNADSEAEFAGCCSISNQLDELKALLDMTEQLRGSEPGVIQGFCL